MSLNKIMLIGRLGADPELKQVTKNGEQVSVTNFTVATSENYQKNGEWHEKTEWHRIVLWRNSAEYAAKKLGKGDTVYVEGKMCYKKNERNGHNFVNPQIEATTFRLVTKANSATSPVTTSANSKAPVTKTPPDDGDNSGSGDSGSDLPF